MPRILSAESISRSYAPLAMLAELSYTGTSPASTTTDSWLDVDATNLIVTFDVPATGEVWVEQEAVCDAGTAGATYQWGLRSGSSDVAGTGTVVTRAASTGSFRVYRRFKVAGLTPGATLTWKWSHRIGGGGTGRILSASPYGPARMTVGKA